MIVRTLHETIGTDRDVDTRSWNSRRLLLRRDGVAFGLHDTVIRAGAQIDMCYRHHVEAVYCVAGTGSVQVLPDGPLHSIEDGTLYTLDNHEPHRLRASTDLRMICVFSPPLMGDEVHDASGAYPLPGHAAK